MPEIQEMNDIYALQMTLTCVGLSLCQSWQFNAAGIASSIYDPQGKISSTCIEPDQSS